MSGDPLRDAFRAEVVAVIQAAGITWEPKDVENVYETEDGLTNFIALEFGGGNESQTTFGAPGANYWDERGQVMVRLVAPLNSGRDTIEDYANTIRLAFRNRRFTTGGGVGIRTNSAPPSGGESGARWILTVAIAYRIYNIA